MAIIQSASRQARQREWAQQLRLRTRLETRYQRALAAEFRRIAAEASLGFEEGRRQGALLAIRGHEAQVRDLTLRQHRVVFATFGQRLEGSLKGFVVPNAKDAEGFFSAAVLRWLQEIAGFRIRRIADTTRSRIVDAILDGEEAGEGVAQIAKRIREATGGVIAATRSHIIARTETHAASTAADDEMIRALNLDEQLVREWVSAEDERTRQAHRAPTDGQIRAMDEPFDVDGVKMDRPGDPSAPARLVINCRCVLAYRGTDLD